MLTNDKAAEPRFVAALTLLCTLTFGPPVTWVEKKMGLDGDQSIWWSVCFAAWKDLVTRTLDSWKVDKTQTYKSYFSPCCKRTLGIFCEIPNVMFWIVDFGQTKYSLYWFGVVLLLEFQGSVCPPLIVVGRGICHNSYTQTRLTIG